MGSILVATSENSSAVHVETIGQVHTAGRVRLKLAEAAIKKIFQ